MALLLLGQIDNAAAPSAPAAELYVLSTAYGNSVGADVPLLIETQDVPPMGPSGVVLFRRVEVPVTYEAACTVQVTPIIDFIQEGTVTSQVYGSPQQRTVDFLDGLVAQVGTAMRGRLEVLARSGPVEIAAPNLIFQPKAQAGAYPVGNAS